MVLTMKGAPIAKFPGSPLGLRPKDLIFDATRGGWVHPDKNRAGQERAPPPHWDQAAFYNPDGRRRKDPTHYEQKHFGAWALDMKKEQGLGLAPPDWSTSSAMDDQRPNGQALFDARFHGQAMGRARGGYGMVSDARGVEFTSGKLKKAENMDSNFFAADMSDETAAAAASAEKNKLGNNSNLSAFQGDELARAGMSALQRATDTSKIDFN